MRKSHASRPSRGQQRGIVLIMALILLMLISGVAVFTIRGSISGEQVSNNIRSSTAALQAAETALRFCEQGVLSSGTPVKVNMTGLDVDSAVPPSLWATRANWTASTTLVNTVTTAFANSSNAAGRSLNKMPLCIVENWELQTAGSNARPRPSYLITARGFSQDYAVNGSGVVIAGSEVWVQSILRQ